MNHNSNYDELLKRVHQVCALDIPKEIRLLEVCNLLKNTISYYDWVGFYITNPDKERELVLGPYKGQPTEHTRISYGQGICGQAAETEKTFIIQDVTLEGNYLSCSPDVRAEIVLPIFRNGLIIGELDIDSHHLAPFTQTDQIFLNQVCEIVSPLL